MGKITFILNNLEQKINFQKETEVCTAGKDTTPDEKIKSVSFLLEKAGFWVAKFKSEKEKKQFAKLAILEVEKNGRFYFETIKNKYSITCLKTIVEHPRQLQLI